METFRLLDTPPLTAAENMALDDTLLTLKGRGKTPNTIRFLQFSPRSVLLGFHQSVREEIRTDYCRAEGIDINRRITGGGAIFFDESQLGWEVICDKAFFNLSVGNEKMFKRLCDPMITALDCMGLSAKFRPRNDIEINGRKISGTGGTESDGAFLFQGTMLVDFDVETMLRSLRIPVEKLKTKEIDSVMQRVTCLKWELGEAPPLARIKEAICRGFKEHLNITLQPGGLTCLERRLFDEKLEYFRSREWIDHVNPRFQKPQTIQSAYKTDAGIIRMTLVINAPQKRLKEIYITGDFLSFPSRGLYDLEARLKGVRLDQSCIEGIVWEFFNDNRIRIPGMSVDDFLKPLGQAFQKIAISNFGIPLEHCNQVSVTNGSFEQVLRKHPSVLLLPYCAKFTECDLRYTKSCSQCGMCSVGAAWTMGLEKKMEVISIVSFEDLMVELKRMKSTGTSGFIGCCCEPFFVKHVDDFAEAGVPGILLNIDNTTCYELDQARQAYDGKFSSQTAINLEMLENVLCNIAN